MQVDQRFDPVRDAAVKAMKLPSIWDGLLTQIGRTDVAESDFPAITLRRAESWARVQFIGGTSLLRFHELAYASECQLRGLLEYQAVVGWIAGKASRVDSGNGSCRALCLELQDDRELIAIASEANTAGSVGQLANLIRRREFHEGFLRDHKCRCAKFNVTNVLSA